MKKSSRKGQEEIVGFGIIIVLVVVVMVVFLWFYLSKPSSQDLDDYEAESFVTTMLQYTTSCKEPGRDYFNVKDLIYSCYKGELCEEGNSCKILDETLEGILKSAWDVGEGSKINGYSLNISVFSASGSQFNEVFSEEAGNFSGSSKGYYEEYAKINNRIEITFNIYS